MTSRRVPCTLALLLLLAPACGDDKAGGDSSGSDTTAGTGATEPGPTTGTTTADASTTGASEPTSSTGASEPTSSTGTTDETSTGEQPALERFKLSRAAGPCPENIDCDGFVELLASHTLRIEKFGEPGNPVIEVELPADEFDAAALVFADPALAAVLDGAEPLCNSPTDIFEEMLVEVDGKSHDAATTACDQAPIAAARDAANALEMKYAP